MPWSDLQFKPWNCSAKNNLTSWPLTVIFVWLSLSSNWRKKRTDNCKIVQFPNMENVDIQIINSNWITGLWLFKQRSRLPVSVRMWKHGYSFFRPMTIQLKITTLCIMAKRESSCPVKQISVICMQLKQMLLMVILWNTFHIGSKSKSLSIFRYFALTNIFVQQFVLVCNSSQHYATVSSQSSLIKSPI